MQITLSRELIDKMVAEGCKNKILADRSWGDITIDSSKLSAADRALIHKVCKGAMLEEIVNRRVISRLKTLEQMEKVGFAGAKVKKLEALAEAIRQVIDKLPRRFVFVESRKYGEMIPYFVESVVYHPPNYRNEQPAYVSMSLKATSRGHQVSDTVSFHRSDIVGGKTALDVLRESEVILETDELMNKYADECKKYESVMNQTGEQFTGVGDAVEIGSDDDDDDRHHRGRNVSLEKDGNAAKLVMDDEIGRGGHSSFTEAFKFDHNVGDNVSDDDIEDEEVDLNEKIDKKDYKIPIHPILRMFKLDTHKFVCVHISSIEEYKYNTGIGDKLVLPNDHRELINALTLSAVERLEDIVAGKAQGVIVLCSGAPGTGKTLTAEVYSEVAKRPLYMVQCSQLGTDEEALEKKLSIVLDRAQRWKAILLIDESDVYIHERGKNIKQNAIVGVFLRLLEYYKGILFCTTNRATIIDDAIISRCTAHVRYDLPRGDARNKIWNILSEKFDAGLSAGLIEKAIIRWPNISGRSIRQLIRLAKFMSGYRKESITLDSLERAAKFHDFDKDEMATEVADKSRELLDV